MTIDNPLYLQASDSLNAYWQMACGFFPRLHKYTSPQLSFHLKGTAAGMAYLNEHRIALNLVLLQENTAAVLSDVLGHEVAHLCAYYVYGARIKPHGSEWKHVMGLFGLPAKARHSFDVSNIKRRKVWRYAYGCKCAGKVFWLGTQRHARIGKGHVYKCLSCHTPLHSLNQKTNEAAPQHFSKSA